MTRVGSDRTSESLGRAIQAFRVEKGLSRANLAKISSVSYSYLSEIENGSKAPSQKVLLRLGEALGVGPSELYARARDISSPAAPREEAWPMGSQASPMQAIGEDIQDVAGRAAPVGEDPRMELEMLLGQLTSGDLMLLLDMARRLARRH